MAVDLRRGDLDHVIDGKRGAQRREDGCCHRARSACHNAGGEHVDITPATMNDREELSFANCIARRQAFDRQRSEEHTSELQSLIRISYAVFCLKKKKNEKKINI